MIKTAMILAAGEGKRMRPLTLDTPKPLLQVGSYRLIEWQLQRLRKAGIERVIINVAYLGQQIIDYLGDGRNYQMELVYSREPEPLETGGALFRALPLFEQQSFLLVNGDIWLDFNYKLLLERSVESMHLLMVHNPEHNPDGDFSLEHGRVITRVDNSGVTFSGVSLVNPAVISDYPWVRERFRLREVYDWLIEQKRLTGEFHDGLWMDIGTPERLLQLREHLESTR